MRRSWGMPSKKGETVDITATSNPEIPICQSGKYHTITPKLVRMLQKVNCVVNQQLSSSQCQTTYTEVNVGSGIDHLPPREFGPEDLFDMLVNRCTRVRGFISLLVTTTEISSATLFVHCIHLRAAAQSYQLFRKPLHVPSTQTLDIFYNNLETVKIQRRDSIEGYVKEDKSPFEEGVDRVC